MARTYVKHGGSRSRLKLKRRRGRSMIDPPKRSRIAKRTATTRQPGQRRVRKAGDEGDPYRPRGSR